MISLFENKDIIMCFIQLFSIGKNMDVLEQWTEFFLAPPRNNYFDEPSLLAFAKSECDNEIYSEDGQTLKNGIIHRLVPSPNWNAETGELHLHIVKRWPSGSSPNTNPPTHSIEFISWICPATGEEYVSRFSIGSEETTEEEKQECYAILRAFFPHLSEYDIKESSID